MFGGIPLHGKERGNIEVFRALKDTGVESLFVTHKEYGHEAIQPFLDRHGLDWTVATYPPRLSKGMNLRTWASRLREITQGTWDFWRVARAYRPTHIHVCSETQFVLKLPAVMALGVPVVYRLGDEPLQHRALFRWLWRRVIIPNVDQFVCISEFVRGKLLEAGGDPARIRVIYNAPPQRPPGFAVGGAAAAISGDEAVAAVAAEPFEGQTVVYMGQLDGHKGVDLLVEVALRLCREREDVRFLIAGDYEWENPFARSLIEKVAVAGLSDRIRFLGYVNDIPDLLNLTDIHVAPSVWEEPLGNVAVEAKRAGVPSVVFPSGGLPELFLEQGVDGLVCDGKDAQALEAGLTHYLDADEVALDAAKAAARASLDRLGITPEAFTRAWREVYSLRTSGARKAHTDAAFTDQTVAPDVSAR